MCHFLATTYDWRMPTMNVSLPQALKDYVDAQVAARRYGTTSEYVRDLIRRDSDRQELRSLLLAGAESEPAVSAEDDWFDALRDRARRRLDG